MCFKPKANDPLGIGMNTVDVDDARGLAQCSDDGGKAVAGAGRSTAQKLCRGGVVFLVQATFSCAFAYGQVAFADCADGCDIVDALAVQAIRSAK